MARGEAWSPSSSDRSPAVNACSSCSTSSSARPASRCPRPGSAPPDVTNWHRTALLRLLKLADLAVFATAFVVGVALATPGPDNWLTILNMRVQVRNVVFLAGFLGYCHLVL